MCVCVLCVLCVVCVCVCVCCCFLFQAEDGIRDLVRSRGLGDVYKRQVNETVNLTLFAVVSREVSHGAQRNSIEVGSDELYDPTPANNNDSCLLYTSDAADERSSVDLGGRRIIKKKTTQNDIASLNTLSKTAKINKKK